MKTLLEVVHLSAAFLKTNGIENAKREAEWLIADALDLKRLDLYLQYDRPLQEEELLRCRESVKRRSQGEPSQYISGKVSFGDCLFSVSKNVLIPRPETEILMEKISKILQGMDLEGKVLLDMCTGSGCLGIALKKRYPLLQVYLSDICEKALEIAKKNALQNNVEVTCLHGDLFMSFQGLKCDFFVCNPPYIAEHEFKDLSREVRDHEPFLALVSGPSGFEMYQRIASEIKPHIHAGGEAWMELGKGQGEKVKALFPSSTLEKDWAGHDRFLNIFF